MRGRRRSGAGPPADRPGPRARRGRRPGRASGDRTCGPRRFRDELPVCGRAWEARPMPASSDHAEISPLRSALDESVRRIVAVADRYRDTERSAVAGDLDSAERGLVAARRALDRALRTLAELR